MLVPDVLCVTESPVVSKSKPCGTMTVIDPPCGPFPVAQNEAYAFPALTVSPLRGLPPRSW